MLQSHVIEVDGVFVAAVALSSQGYRFVAVAQQLSALSGAAVESPQAARRLAIHALRRPLVGLRADGEPDQRARRSEICAEGVE